MNPCPTGERHDVGVDELFFSTTDARGVIQQANSVFVRLSRFPRSELVGAPHNIIRHPAMPGGAFRLMWETLQAGEPFCAYVDNLAADGSTYGVFATITPLGDGYLSVRVRPCADGLHDAAFSLYGEARPLELVARDQGVGAHEASEIGLTKLAELLAGAGFASYEEFIWTALPAEVQARSRQSGGIARRADAVGALADMLRATTAIETELQAWSGRMDDLQDVADRLLAAAPHLTETMAQNEATTERINAGGSQAFSSAMVWLRVWADMAAEVSGMVGALIDDIHQLRRSCAKTRCRIVLTMLHDAAVGQFVVELIDAIPGSDEARPAIADLCRALDEGVSVTLTHAAANAVLAGGVADRIASVGELLELPQTMITEWLGRADRTSTEFATMAGAVQAQVERTQADIDLLASLAAECRRVATALDGTPVDAHLRHLRDLQSDAA